MVPTYRCRLCFACWQRVEVIEVSCVFGDDSV
jgi:hypothetical protein